MRAAASLYEEVKASELTPCLTSPHQAHLKEKSLVCKLRSLHEASLVAALLHRLLLIGDNAVYVTNMLFSTPSMSQLIYSSTDGSSESDGATVDRRAICRIVATLRG